LQLDSDDSVSTEDEIAVFFLSETETFDQLFLRCLLVAAVGAYCSYFQKVE
jgi:hypothetical protein